MEYASEDLAATLATLERLEAERKLRSIPAPLLESSWALEAQTEAVVDALLAALAGGNDREYAHARHVGEWCARIAAELPCAPAPAFLRRCGVLADTDPAVLERIREVRDCAPVVRSFQRMQLCADTIGGIDSAGARIIAVAEEFDSALFAADEERRYSPGDALRMLIQTADEHTRPIVEALRRALRNAPATLLHATA